MSKAKKENYGKETQKRGLQKFTHSEFLDRLLKQSKIGNEDISKLPKVEQIAFNKYFTQIFNTATAERKDELLEKVIDALPENARNEIWEINQMNILNAIQNYIEICGTMPTKTRIAEATGLTRQTIDKHFKELPNNPLFKEYEDQFKVMIPKVLGEVMRQVLINQDMRAGKIFLDFFSKKNERIGTQNNYIQINGMIFTEEKIKQLPPEQLKAIETILTTAEPQTMEAEVIPSAEDESRN